MRIPLSWLREYCPTDLSADEIAGLVGRQGIHVEGILRPWADLGGVIVAKVLEVRDHPNSDKLCIARIGHGTGEQEVVVGVRNMAAGDLVPWAGPGSTVPVLPGPLAAREIRGVVSNGMLCSPRELAIADVHTGILVLNDEGVEVGDDLQTALGLDDVVLDIEVEPNRPDFLSVYGVAREVSAGTGIPLVPVDTTVLETGERAAALAGVRIDASDACPRYVARVIQGVSSTARSPLRVQARLTASGMRPISAVVDATNYAMLELGQPLHGFDMDLLAGPGIIVRRAEGGERMVTLDDEERQLSSDDLLICDMHQPVAIAGVMGGATSEISDATSNILLESAYFTRGNILRTARRLELHTEASHRFERGTDPENLDRAADRCASLIAAWAGGSVLAGVAEAGEPHERHWVSMRPTRASDLLGHQVTPALCRDSFQKLGFATRGTDEIIEVEVPGYRVDIEREVDLIEEVARIEGYDRVGTSIPPIRQSGGEPPAFVFRERVRDALVRAGLREVRLPSFASGDDLALTAGIEAIQLANPLQTEEGFMRTRLMPGLLRGLAVNQARGVRAVAIFEVGEVFRVGNPVDERTDVAFVLSGLADEGWAADARELDVLDAKGVLEALAIDLGVSNWVLGADPGAPFHPSRSASISIDGERAGEMGELHPRTAAGLGLSGRVAVCEIELAPLMADASGEFALREIPRFPPVRRDLAFVVPRGTPSASVDVALRDAAGPLLDRSVLFDVFEGQPIAEDRKSLAFAVEFRAPDRTLTDEETDEAVEMIKTRLGAEFGAEMRAG